MREPRWTRGAYSSPPHLVSRTDGDYKCVAEIECWRGTSDELVDPIEKLADAVSSGRFDATVSWHDGLHDFARSGAELRELLAGRSDSDMAGMRTSCESEDGTRGLIIASSRVPGLRLEISGQDRHRIQGVADLTFQRMMIGYVDRAGGFRRGAAWLLAAVAPVLLISLAVSPGDAEALARAVSVAAAVISGFVSMAVVGLWTQESRSFVLLTEPPGATRRLVVERVRVISRHRSTLWLLGSMWALFLGVVGNKLADALHWP